MKRASGKTGRNTGGNCQGGKGTIKRAGQAGTGAHTVKGHGQKAITCYKPIRGLWQGQLDSWAGIGYLHIEGRKEAKKKREVEG